MCKKCLPSSSSSSSSSVVVVVVVVEITHVKIVNLFYTCQIVVVGSSSSSSSINTFLTCVENVNSFDMCHITTGYSVSIPGGTGVEPLVHSRCRSIVYTTTYLQLIVRIPLRTCFIHTETQTHKTNGIQMFGFNLPFISYTGEAGTAYQQRGPQRGRCPDAFLQ
jgi:hypothetical protein